VTIKEGRLGSSHQKDDDDETHKVLVSREQGKDTLPRPPVLIKTMVYLGMIDPETRAKSASE